MSAVNDDDHSDELAHRGEHEKSAPKRKRTKQSPNYPADIPRLTRKGKGTYAVGCGPLPDEIDWSAINYAGLKEQCMMRGMPPSGKMAELIARLTSYREADRTAAIAAGVSDLAKKNLKKSQEERMYLVEYRHDSQDRNPGLDFQVYSESSSQYSVRIGMSLRCTCPATMYHRQPVCKHIVFILSHILRVPDSLVSKTSFRSDELGTVFEPVLGPPSDKYAMPVDLKTLAAGNCPVCFKGLDDGAATTSCTECHAMTHVRCFNMYTHIHSGWQRTICVMCHQDWTQPGVWGWQGILTENEEVARAKAEAKAAEKLMKMQAKK